MTNQLKGAPLPNLRIVRTLNGDELEQLHQVSRTDGVWRPVPIIDIRGASRDHLVYREKLFVQAHPIDDYDDNGEFIGHPEDDPANCTYDEELANQVINESIDEFQEFSPRFTPCCGVRESECNVKMTEEINKVPSRSLSCPDCGQCYAPHELVGEAR